MVKIVWHYPIGCANMLSKSSHTPRSLLLCHCFLALRPMGQGRTHSHILTLGSIWNNFSPMFSRYRWKWCWFEDWNNIDSFCNSMVVNMMLLKYILTWWNIDIRIRKLIFNMKLILNECIKISLKCIHNMASKYIGNKLDLQ